VATKELISIVAIDFIDLMWEKQVENAKIGKKSYFGLRNFKVRLAFLEKNDIVSTLFKGEG